MSVSQSISHSISQSIIQSFSDSDSDCVSASASDSDSDSDSDTDSKIQSDSVFLSNRECQSVSVRVASQCVSDNVSQSSSASVLGNISHCL